MLSRDTVNRIKEVDIIDVISGYLEIKKKGDKYWACCPFHQEKTPSFVVSQKRQKYHCFGCGEDGDSISFVMAHRGLSFMAACEEIAKTYHIDLVRDVKSDYVPRQVKDQLWEDKAILAMAESSTNISYADKQRVNLAKNRIEGIKKKYNLT